MKYFIPILSILIISCDSNYDNDNNNCGENAIYSNFQSITHTDENGNILSNEDENDWQCCIGEQLDKTTSMVPYGTSISPAYPNPSSGNIKIEFSNEVSTFINIYVINEYGDTVEIIIYNEFIPTGKHTFSWNPSTEGIYRIILESEDEDLFYCYGDICYCPNYENCDSFCDY